jgi:hypothetical protein
LNRLNVRDRQAVEANRLSLLAAHLQHLWFGAPLNSAAGDKGLYGHHPGLSTDCHAQDRLAGRPFAVRPPMLMDRVVGTRVKDTAETVYSPGVNVDAAGADPTQRHSTTRWQITSVDDT